MSMSPRERLLLIVLCAVVILFGGFKLLIEPGIKQMNDSKAQLAIIEDKLLTSKNNVLLSASIDDKNKKLEKTILTNSTPFFPELVQGKLQIWFQSYLVSNGIVPTNLAFSPPTITAIREFPLDNNTPTYPIGDAAGAISEIDKGQQPTTTVKSDTPAPTKSEDIPKDSVEMIAVSLQYVGTYNQTIKFLDSIYNSGKYIKVTSAIISIANGVTTINVEAECYGIKKYVNNDVY